MSAKEVAPVGNHIPSHTTRHSDCDKGKVVGFFGLVNCALFKIKIIGLIWAPASLATFLSKNNKSFLSNTQPYTLQGTRWHPE